MAGTPHLGLNAPLGRDNWPIAAAMINFAGSTITGVAAQDQSPEQWAKTLGQVRDAGFRHVDPTDSWLRVADLSPERQAEFAAVVEDLDLAMVSLSTARRSVIDPDHGDEYLEYSHRVLDVAAELGIGTVSFGLFGALTPEQRQALWFWTVRGTENPEDEDVRRTAIERIRELGEHGESIDVYVSLEMYEDTYLGTADDAVSFVTDVDHPYVGLNPDLGNLVRLHRPVEPWQDMVAKTLPYSNYWHVKNYYRAEDPATGAVMTIPSPMEFGVINYREAVAYAIESGYRGAFCVEHYGGDGLSASATNRDYLRRILPAEVPS